MGVHMGMCLDLGLGVRIGVCTGMCMDMGAGVWMEGARGNPWGPCTRVAILCMDMCGHCVWTGRCIGVCAHAFELCLFL